jgi:hypothetical protein
MKITIQKFISRITHLFFGNCCQWLGHNLRQSRWNNTTLQVAAWLKHELFARMSVVFWARRSGCCQHLYSAFPSQISVVLRQRSTRDASDVLVDRPHRWCCRNYTQTSCPTWLAFQLASTCRVFPKTFADRLLTTKLHFHHCEARLPHLAAYAVENQEYLNLRERK